MNREIKFRGKRIDNGEWVYGYLHVIDTTGRGYTGRAIQVQHGTARPFSVVVDPETVGQYIDLHDDTEDQNELYEGDIAEIEYEGEKYICEIKFCAGGFMFVNDSLPDSYVFLHEYAEYDRKYGWVEGSRKIGNIHEHPHLLGGAE